MYNDEKLWRYDHPPVPLTSSPKATPICFQGATRVTWQRWHCPRARRRQNTQPTNQAAWPYRHPLVPASATGNAKASFRKSCKCRQRRIQLSLALTHLKVREKARVSRLLLSNFVSSSNKSDSNFSLASASPMENNFTRQDKPVMMKMPSSSAWSGLAILQYPSKAICIKKHAG